MFLAKSLVERLQCSRRIVVGFVSNPKKCVRSSDAPKVLGTLVEFQRKAKSRFDKRTFLLSRCDGLNDLVHIRPTYRNTETLYSIRDHHAVSTFESVRQIFLWRAADNTKQDGQRQNRFH